ncbi:MAG: HD domain-containing protein [Acidimicrobiales bacterium]|nr:HD domain-containing protein [Acidimicrobiales bacterium]HLV89930.1 HD domain-containing protein [Acidimicrobiia bacterium]
MLLARPLSEDEVSTVRAWVGSDRLLELFMAQQVADQRHGYETGKAVAAAGHRLELVAAAALHDVGKIHSRFGPVRRSIATVLMGLKLPLGGRWAAYRDHGELGAIDLERAGASDLIVSFARHHQHRRPPEMAPEDWSVLNRADLGTLTGTSG